MGHQEARLSYLPGLDGLRALAVMAVVFYHAGMRWMPGGFLGVEVFFVISGYLITSLLLTEWRRTDLIAFQAFWLRRARRLLPALFVTVIGVLAYAVLFLPGEVASIRGDALASFGYVANWYQIFEHQSYFAAAGRPPLLRHLWSLAVEGQFYLFWPLLFAVLMRRWRRRYVFLAVLGLAAASTVLMAVLYQPGVDPSRIYYGTDTRAAGLLIGAALAFVWAAGQDNGPAHRAFPLLLDTVGLAAMGVLVGFFIRLDEFQPLLYQGGFALVALTTAALIVVAVHPRAHLGTSLLGQPLLRWIGLRSYSIYLWHWPVFMVTRPQLDLPIDGLPLLVLRLAVAALLAELSYRCVETPFRSGALGRAWQALRQGQGARRRQLGLRWAGAASALVALGVLVACAQPAPPPSCLAVAAVHTTAWADSDVTPQPVDSVVASPTAAVPEPSITATALAPSPTLPPATPSPAPTPSPTPTPATKRPPAGVVTAIGDSVMLGAVGDLERDLGNVEIDAAIGRQVSTAIEILRADKAAGHLGSVVVLHVGNNGTFTAKQLDEIMQLLGDVPRVVFVNVKVPRTWESPNNDLLAQNVKRYPNAALVDWHGASANHPEYFWDDGIHLRPDGAQAYADLIAGRVTDRT